MSPDIRGCCRTTYAAAAPDLMDIDGTFLPIGQMRQIARVTSLRGQAIEGEVDLGAINITPRRMTERIVTRSLDGYRVQLQALR